jgi:CBS domain-containing protein
MERTVSSIMQTVTHSVGMDDTLSRAQEILDTHRLSALPVLDAGNAPLGIITRYSLAQSELRGKQPDSTRVWEVCSYKPVSLPPDASLKQAAELMLQRHIHHVLVMHDGVMKGIVSSLDFVKLFLSPDIEEYGPESDMSPP